MRVRVCVYVLERERKREREGVMIIYFIKKYTNNIYFNIVDNFIKYLAIRFLLLFFFRFN